MTEHRKNVKNRKRDLESHHQHVHNYDETTIAGGVLVLNGSRTFWSPLRGAQITTHRDVRRLLAHCVAEAQAISTRSGPLGAGLDAKAVIVLDHDNQNLQRIAFYTAPPAPQIGSPMHYEAFIQNVCSRWRLRFG